MHYTNPSLNSQDPSQESIIDATKAAICKNLILFVKVNDEDCETFLKQFLEAVWGLLTSTSLQEGQVLHFNSIIF